MSRGSRDKGNRGEIEVARLIRNWWWTVDPDAVFERTPLSGGHRSASSLNLAGDLMTSSERWPFVVEVKRREHWSLLQLVEGGASPLWGWWAHLVREARGNDNPGRRAPMLWVRRSREPWFVLVERSVIPSSAPLPTHVGAVINGDAVVVMTVRNLFTIPATSF